MLWKNFDISKNKEDWNELYKIYEESIEEIIKNYFEYFNFSLDLQNK